MPHCLVVGVRRAVRDRITLENVVSKVHTEKQRKAESDPKRAITAMLSEAGLSELSASDIQDIKAMLAQQRRGGPSQPKKRCDKCGAFHMGTCFAQMIADGKYPDAFKKLDVATRGKFETLSIRAILQAQLLALEDDAAGVDATEA